MTKEAPKRHLKVKMAVFHTGLWCMNLILLHLHLPLMTWGHNLFLAKAFWWVPMCIYQQILYTICGIYCTPHQKKTKKRTHTYGSSETAKLICSFWLDAINFTTENITNQSFHGVIFRGVLQMKPNSTSQVILTLITTLIQGQLLTFPRCLKET